VVAEFVAEAADGEGGGVVQDGGVVVVEVCFAVDGAGGYWGRISSASRTGWKVGMSFSRLL